MSWYGFRPYVPVAERRRRAEKELAKLKKKGEPITPVKIEGREIAKSFWGKSWCANLERYSDYESRLPRGRTYVRNGSVVDLQIAKGEVAAMVAGSDLYRVKVAIAPVTAPRWKATCRDCAGGIDSLVELLQGRFAKGVMDRVCRAGDGLFPSPGEIKLKCSCPDWADMCKHVAAVLYGVGARLDHDPQLMFVLRGVDHNDLLVGASDGLTLKRPAARPGKVLDDGDVAALFGLEMADTTPQAPAAARPKAPRRPAATANGKVLVAKKGTAKKATRSSGAHAKTAGKQQTLIPKLKAQPASSSGTASAAVAKKPPARRKMRDVDSRTGGAHGH